MFPPIPAVFGNENEFTIKAVFINRVHDSVCATVWVDALLRLPFVRVEGGASAILGERKREGGAGS